MKRIVFTFTILLCALMLCAQPVDWLRSMGGNGNEGAMDVATDALGNVYTTGYFQDTVDFDPGPGTYTLASAGGYDIYVIKLDPAGNFVWARSFGQQLDDEGISLATDASGNLFVCGAFKDTVDFDPGPSTYNLNASLNFDGFVLKLDPSGNFVWAAEIGGADNDYAHGIHVDASGNVLITGIFLFTADFDPGVSTYNLMASLRDVFVWKLSNSGNFIWARAMGGSGNDYCYNITTDAIGNIYTAGSFVGVADFDPGPGTYTMTSLPGFGCAFVSKLDASGSFVWAIRYLGTHVSEAVGLALTPNSELIVTGVFKGTCDLDPGPGTTTFTAMNLDGYVIKANSNTGNTIWANAITGFSDQFALGTKVDALGNIYVAGHYKGLTDFDPWPGAPNVPAVGSDDLFLCTYDGFGNLLNIFTAGGSGTDWAYDLAISNTGDVHLVGGYSGAVAFGPANSLPGVGNTDSFVLKFTNCNYLIVASPVNDTVQAGATAQFGVSSAGMFFQWQENTGLGFADLSNGGQYIGANASALTISNVTLGQNNNLYRCLVSSVANTPTCSLSSAIATLSVYDGTGLEETGMMPSFSLYPNPAADVVLLQAPSSAKGMLYLLSDQTGRAVLKGVINENSTFIDLEGIAPGLYMIQINGLPLRPQKIVKQ
jgi:hypothetical protein